MAKQEDAAPKKQEVAGEEQTRAGRTFVPQVDICETPEGLWLWADMPGVDDKSVEVRLDEGVLTIQGQVSLEDYENLAPVYTEYNVGNYFRRFSLSQDVDTDHIKGRMNNGVLQLELPKSARAKPRRIEVTVS
jgi:HSP20 family molecular chaperone IbpA